MASKLLYQYQIQFYKSGIYDLWTIFFAYRKKPHKLPEYLDFEYENPILPVLFELLDPQYALLDLDKNLFAQMYF